MKNTHQIWKALAILALSAVAAFAQFESATLTGVITDSSGQIVPGAAVRASTLSEPQMPQPCTRKRSSPGPGAGTSISRSSKVSGPTSTCARALITESPRK